VRTWPGTANEKKTGERDELERDVMREGDEREREEESNEPSRTPSERTHTSRRKLNSPPSDTESASSVQGLSETRKLTNVVPVTIQNRLVTSDSFADPDQGLDDPQTEFPTLG